MDAIARAWKKAVRTALPGPWPRRRIVGEALLALVMGGAATLLELVAHSGPAVLIGLATVLLCLLRRAFPASVLLATAAIGGYALGPFPMLVCAAWTVGSRIRRVWVLAGTFVVGWVVFTVTGTLKDGASVSPKLIIGLSLGTFLLIAVLPALWGRYRAQRRALTDALRERNEQLVRERVMVVHQARLRERHRIAQDMHDSLGHQLALISVHSSALEVDRTLNERQREAVGVLRQAAVSAMRELREVVGVLHDESTAVASSPSPAPSAGGVDGIAALVDASRSAGARVELTSEGERRPLAAVVDHAAYRIVQEALTNAHKHAPGAPIAVALRYEPDALVVEVGNARAPEPVGARPGAHAPVSGGQGLAGLRERARLVGGMVHAGPTPEQGFRLAAVLPYEGAESEGAAAASDLDDWALAGLEAVPEPEGRRRSPAIGCAVGVVGVSVALLALLAWGVFAFIQGANDATVSLPVYERLVVGMPESQVKEGLPSGNDFFTGDYHDSGPQRPAGAHCRWFLSGEQNDKWAEQNVMRFCFRDGVLVEKAHYPVRD
ncbi:sensor histidine kinase [Streptomyces sp. NRRL WC-3742]|uniref:sensor histidine kinase n=1 Tax=Streptomyces sp. NRRL WC-3742 TaxID=1463934 RepID=UPI00068FF951|nr:histidine kinase [Streptomyces sp. NRRL WC-3742]